jgi:hypothetical protein
VKNHNDDVSQMVTRTVKRPPPGWAGDHSERHFGVGDVNGDLKVGGDRPTVRPRRLLGVATTDRQRPVAVDSDHPGAPGRVVLGIGEDTSLHLLIGRGSGGRSSPDLV